MKNKALFLETSLGPKKRTNLVQRFPSNKEIMYYRPPEASLPGQTHFLRLSRAAAVRIGAALR